MGRVHRQSTASHNLIPLLSCSIAHRLFSSLVADFNPDVSSTAEFRGPGVHHRYDENSDDYDMDMEQRTRFRGSFGSRIILLSDGTELTHENEDVEMFDRDDEERDVDALVSKNDSEEGESDSDHEARNRREDTPGPSLRPAAASSAATGSAFPLVALTDSNTRAESPSSDKTERSENEGTQASHEAAKDGQTTNHATDAGPEKPGEQAAAGRS